MKPPKCIVCEKSYSKGRQGFRGITRRIPAAQTCSSKCSKVYTRVRLKFYSEYYSKLRSQKDKYRKIVDEFKIKLKEYHQALTSKIGYLVVSRNIDLEDEQKIYDKAMKILKKIK